MSRPCAAPLRSTRTMHSSYGIVSVGKVRARVLSRRPVPAACAQMVEPNADVSLRKLASRAAAALASAVLLASPVQAEYNISPSTPLYDEARILSPEKRAALSQKIQQLEETSGWRLRIYTHSSLEGGLDRDALRAAWRPDARSVVLLADPSSPNLLNTLYLGDQVVAQLRRPFWFELQGRYGNMFFVREEGEAAAVEAVVDTLVTCLPSACRVVPGLTPEQYGYTLALAAAGGLVCGAAGTLEPQGFVQRRWIWVLVFSPLWASLFVNFGIGPIVARTDDPMPVLANTAAFATAVALISFRDKFSLVRPRGDGE